MASKHNSINPIRVWALRQTSSRSVPSMLHVPHGYRPPLVRNNASLMGNDTAQSVWAPGGSGVAFPPPPPQMVVPMRSTSWDDSPYRWVPAECPEL